MKALAIRDLEADADIMALLNAVPDPENDVDIKMLAIEDKKAEAADTESDIDFAGDFRHDNDSAHEEKDKSSTSASESDSPDLGDDPRGGDRVAPAVPEALPRPRVPRAKAAPKRTHAAPLTFPSYMWGPFRMTYRPRNLPKRRRF